MKGVYPHRGKQHLHRYLAEFDFRYNLRNVNDSVRSSDALSGVKGKIALAGLIASLEGIQKRSISLSAVAMANKRIKFRLGGPEEFSDSLQLNEFVDKLEAIGKAILATDRIVSNSPRATIKISIAALSKASPAEVTLELRPATATGPDNCDAIISTFMSAVDNIQQDSAAPDNFDRHTLEAFKKIGIRAGDKLTEIVVKTDDAEVQIGEVYIENVDSIIGPDQAEFGSVKGRIEYLNIHNKNVFYLYPPTGGRVKCNFPEVLKEKVIRGVDKTNSVRGILKLKRSEFVPYEIDANDITTIEDGDSQTTLRSMRGIEPDRLNGEHPADFVERLRDEW